MIEPSTNSFGSRFGASGILESELLKSFHSVATSRTALLLWLGPSRAVNGREAVWIRIVAAAQNSHALLHRCNLRGL